MHRLVRPDVGDEELAAIHEAFEDSVLSTGEIVVKFERAFAAFTDRPAAAAVTSGSVALELALVESDLEGGDRVMVSPFNCSAVLYALVRADLEPVFVDVDLDTFNLDPDAARAAIERLGGTVEGILVTHTYGVPCRMDEIVAIGNEYGLTVINDFCQAPGATYDGDPVGSFGALGVCSFSASKNITTAEGGMVVGEPEMVESVRQRRANDGVDIERPPQNVKMSDVEAAMGRTQLRRYPQMRRLRREYAAVYDEQLPEAVTAQAAPSRSSPVYHRYAIRTDRRDALARDLQERGIEAKPVIEKSLHTYECAPSTTRALPETERLIAEGLLLPLHSRLSSEAVADIAAAVESSLDA